MSLARDYVTSSVSIIEYETKTQHLTVGQKNIITEEPGDGEKEEELRQSCDVTMV